MKTIADFGKYAKRRNRVASSDLKTAVVYTRVSSKEQADNNLSLEFQRKTIEEYAHRSGIRIESYFGGTYESAKSDGRKEFNRMLDFIKRNKGKVSHVLVYTLDRFSRTGGGAIKIAEDLREKHGVTVFAVTQPADTSNPSGVLQQSIHFIFSQYDNQLRKQRAVAGMKEKYEKGIWVTKAPMGYDIVRTSGERKIVVNAIGKKLRKAFIWKSEGMKNDEIIGKLNAMGVQMYKQQMTKIFKNPFYCGLIANAMLNGRVIEGIHEKLISKEVFFKVNEIHEQSAGYGVSHKRERDAVPLKVFINCDKCAQPFTGYVVKAKGLWYYKCRTNGCKCNKSAKQMHLLFGGLLDRYTIKEKYIEALKQNMLEVWNDINKDNIEQERAYRKQLTEVNASLDTIEDKHYVKETMSEEVFLRLSSKYKEERKKILDELEKVTPKISNPSEAIDKAISFSLELAPRWHSAEIKDKEKLQKLLFPEGIVYDRKNDAFRTDRINVIFLLLTELQSISANIKKGQTGILDRLSLSAEREGFEPPDLLQSTVFKTAAIDRSAISPGSKLDKQQHYSKGFFAITYIFIVVSHYQCASCGQFC
jgi:site-specific DNA recombinase